MNEYRDKHLLDVTDPQEPDYETHFTMRRDSDYEKWIDGLQPSIQQLNEMGDEYERNASNTIRT